MAVAAPPKLKQPPAPTAADLERQKDQSRAWDASRGKYKPAFRPEDEDNKKFNVMPDRCGPVIRIGMYLLFGQGVAIDLDENAPPDAAPYLKKAWGDEDDFVVFLQKLAISGGVNGQAFVQIVPPMQPGDYARFILVDPQTVSVITDEDDCERANTFIVQNSWDIANGQKKYKRRIYYRVTPEEESPYGPTQNDSTKATWQISTWMAQGSGGATATYTQQGDTLNWSYPFPPIITAQNLPNPHEFWGMPDVTNLDIDMNEALAFVESNTLKIIYNYAHDVQAIEGVNNPNQQPIKNEPGKILVLPVGAHLVAVQSHGDIPGSLSFASNLRDDMDESSGMNQVVLGRAEVLPRGTISGLAIKMEYETALQKTFSKRHTIGKLVRKLCQVHLYFGHIDPNADTVQVILGWKDPMPIDEFSQWQGAPIEEQMGVSKTTSLARRGLVYSAELKLRQQEAQMEAAAFNAGAAPAPQAAAAGKEPLPPELQQLPQGAPPENTPAEGEPPPA